MNAHETNPASGASSPSPSGVDDFSDGELWDAVRTHASQAAREALFLRYLPFARRTAMRTLRMHGIAHIEFADVYQSACIGLIQAIDRYDPSQAVQFTTYATYRVQGAVLNDIKTYSELQQQIAARGRNRCERLESQRPDHVTPASSRETIVEALAAVSMGLAIGFMLEDSSVYAETDEAAMAPDSGYETLAWKQAQASLQQQVDALPESERKVLAYHYFQGLTFANVAALLGVSRSRVSQIHKQGLMQLRRQFLELETLSSAV